MGTLAAGFRVLLLAEGEVSLVVHFLYIVRCYSVKSLFLGYDPLLALAF